MTVILMTQNIGGISAQFLQRLCSDGHVLRDKIRLAIIIKVYAVTGILFSIAHMIYQSDIAIWKCDTMYPLHPSGTNFSNSARLSFEEYPHSTELRASIAI